MSRTNFQELLDAGVHFGHLARKWNPKMAPYIFDQKNGIHIIDLHKKWNPRMAPYIFDQKSGKHIIDLHKTIVKIDEAAEEMKQLAKSGRKILFVATKKQAKELVKEKATAVNMPSITERWAGGMLTLGRRYADQLPDDPQGRQENVHHRQDERGRYLRQARQA